MSRFLILIILAAFAASAGAQAIQPYVKPVHNNAYQSIPPSKAQTTPSMSGPQMGGDSLGSFRGLSDSTLRRGALAAHTVQPDSVIRIGLMLPLDAYVNTDKLYASMSDNEMVRNSLNQLKETNQNALDFYEGLQFSLSTGWSKQKIAIYTFDTQDNDSLVQELVKSDSLRMCDIIIGPTNFAQAKTVAAFCKKNQIINIQPFVASKSFSGENPYLVRFMPTIDAHLQKEYEMVLDSFDDANIIIFSTTRERDLSAARQLDTLFKSYNDINVHKLRYTFESVADSNVALAKTKLTSHLLPKERNVVLMTCYDPPMVNALLRNLKDNVIVFGMPTWTDAEQIRADYLSKAQPYVTDNFYADTSRTLITGFITSYSTINNQQPSRYSYLGYDAMNYLTMIFDKYGKAFTTGFNNESYEGLAYSFHISPVIRTSRASGEPVINYYTNTAMHLFQVSDYKVLLVK